MIKPKLKYKRLPNLDGKEVLIVGGTDGMGANLAIACKTLGANVQVIGRHFNPALEVKQEILDVFNHHSLPQFYQNKDYCLNNIGYYYKGTIEKTNQYAFTDVLARNLTITYNLTRMALKHMNPGGVLVNMASRPTLDSYHSWSAYTIAKQGVITLTQSAAEEGNLKCYSVCPSRVDTKFRDAIFPDEDKSTRLDPAEVADLILRLFNGKNKNGSYYWIKKI